ncbi:hypothetical protein LCGC14_1310400 [marine sediment metagenome]|uniref:Serine protease n=1 Tax=marine sediment metagenome TaxID=412755 RepID=A0A0F9NQ19_9ZZZZ|nr:serine protease [Pricia sp.]
MKKVFISMLMVFIIVFGLLQLGMYVKNNPTQVEMIRLSMRSVVQVTHPSYPGYPASGFYIGNDIVVTAGHVAEMEPNGIIFEDGTEYEVLKSIVHPDYDCGFLLLHSVKKPALEFDSVKLKRGENLFILGNPLQLIFCVTKGIVSSVSANSVELFGKVILIQTDAAAFNGNSGSCVLDDDGEVQGVLVGYRVPGIEFVVPTEAILKALKEAKLEIY